VNIPFRTYHLKTFFEEWDGQNPLDLSLYQFFKERRALGSKDRKAITTAVYDIIKWKRLIDFPNENISMDERIERYLDGKFRELKEVPGAVKVSLPDFLWDSLVKTYGEEKALEIGEILNTRAPLTLRVNTLKTTTVENRLQRHLIFLEKVMIQFKNSSPCFQKQELTTFHTK